MIPGPLAGGADQAPVKSRTGVIHDIYNEPEDAWQVHPAERPGYSGGVPITKMVRDHAPYTTIILFGHVAAEACFLLRVVREELPPCRQRFAVPPLGLMTYAL